MATVLNLLVLMTLLAAHPGMGVEILELTLRGGQGEYIDANSNAKYVLACSFRSGYDEPVQEVRWLRYGSPVYVWKANSHNPSVSGTFLGLLDTYPANEPHNLHFTRLEYSLAGNYTCEVVTQDSTARKSYDLHVVDVYPIPFEASVGVLSEEGEAPIADDVKYITDYEDEETEIHFENAKCTLVWSFRTPAIFPRPNITCGYFSLLSNEVEERLPAGLTMHQFSNGSWQASFKKTHVQVADIPKDMRLGCTVKIPETSYNEVVMPEDDFHVDNLIDSAGCPSLDFEDGELLVGIMDATTTCRGDYLSTTRDQPAIARLSCPPGHEAVFRNGETQRNWVQELSCLTYEQTWRSLVSEDQPSLGEIFNVKDLPACHIVVSAGYSVASQISTLALTTMLALALVHNI
ncbi:uncharacterized protein LOC122267792 [Penaeus japonicus]|uniref:uncharacterized protein LOC122267792 n=1 Tax=Penaeus japonicus TaxID=27405 RepID=UPI001C712877|nr:uncharacterized protein LOC122267792 [Penaeus japonicus]